MQMTSFPKYGPYRNSRYELPFEGTYTTTESKMQTIFGIPHMFETKRKDTFGQPKVQNPGLAALGNKDIRWLDGTMHNALCVRGVQRIGNLDPQFQQLVSVVGNGLADHGPPLCEWSGS
jgi:hypothetical protein